MSYQILREWDFWYFFCLILSLIGFTGISFVYIGMKLGIGTSSIHPITGGYNSNSELGNPLGVWDFPRLHPRVNRFIEHGSYTESKGGLRGLLQEENADSKTP